MDFLKTKLSSRLPVNLVSDQSDGLLGLKDQHQLPASQETVLHGNKNVFPMKNILVAPKSVIFFNT